MACVSFLYGEEKLCYFLFDYQVTYVWLSVWFYSQVYNRMNDEHGDSKSCPPTFWAKWLNQQLSYVIQLVQNWFDKLRSEDPLTEIL